MSTPIKGSERGEDEFLEAAGEVIADLKAAGYVIVPAVVCLDCGRGPAPAAIAEPCPHCGGVGSRASSLSGYGHRALEVSS